ncbi:MAG: DNA methyltransferase [Candidatus Poribacteria bacterium]|nr:DNA methyltransferase [Candidatus Poribacteria bacterium]
MANETAANFASQTIWTGDNLDIMRGMNSECFDLIYLDPPFNSGANYAAPIGSKAAGAAFKDTWGLDDVKLIWHGEIKRSYPGLYALLTTTREIHGDSMMSYLIYMAIRVMEMRRLLKPTGSIYLHCDPTASHYLKLLMDAVFGKANFRNEIVWAYTGPGSPNMKNFPRKHDIILRYTRGDTWVWNTQYIPYATDFAKKSRKTEANIWGATDFEEMKRREERGKPVEDWWSDINASWYMPKIEKTGFKTQKPLPLLRRIVAASSNKGDLVLDPFCGCATTCVAAEQLGREWVGIDISAKAAELVQSRMKEELGMLYQGAHRSDIPKRTDLGVVPRYNCLENKKALYGEQGGFCWGCREHFEPRHLEVDHVIAKTKGGSDHISNLQLLCSSCNRTKGNESQEELLRRLTDKGWLKRRHEMINGGSVTA